MRQDTVDSANEAQFMPCGLHAFTRRPARRAMVLMRALILCARLFPFFCRPQRSTRVICRPSMLAFRPALPSASFLLPPPATGVVGHRGGEVPGRASDQRDRSRHRFALPPPAHAGRHQAMLLLPVHMRSRPCPTLLPQANACHKRRALPQTGFMPCSREFAQREQRRVPAAHRMCHRRR